MTIGIGLLCEQGKCILIGADKRASYGDPSFMANDESGKLFDLPFGFCGAIAGTVSYCEAAISEMYHRMNRLEEGKRSVEYIKGALKAALHHTHLGLIETALMKNCAIAMNQYWHDKDLVSRVREYAEEVIQETALPVQSIIGGFHGESPILLLSDGLEIFEEVSPGNAAIGSGAVVALHWLCYRRQNASMSAPRSFMHLVEAKQFSELVPTVGPVANYVMLTRQGMRPLEGQSPLLSRWWAACGLQSSDVLDGAEERMAFLGAFGIPADTLT